MRTYGTISFSSSPVQTFAEPLTLGEIKQFLELPQRSPVDNVEDAMLEGFISGAREVAELMQGRDLIVKQYDLALDHFTSCYSSGFSGGFQSYLRHGSEIQLRTPLKSVDLVRYRDSDGDFHTLVENTDYIVDLSRGLILPPYGESWPSFTAWPSSAVLVRFTSGFASDDQFWSDAGQRILIGMKELIAAWFTHRLPFGIGRGSGEEFPYAVTQLLSAGAVTRVH